MDQEEKNLSQKLIDAGFELKFKDYGSPATEGYFKNIDGNEFEIEFLTDRKARVGKERNVEIAGVSAQPLSFLDMSLKEVVGFETDSGQKGQVVSPAASLCTTKANKCLLKVYET